MSWLSSRLRLAYGSEHALVEGVVKKRLLLLLLLIYEQALVACQRSRHIVLREEGTQNVLLLLRGFTLPVAFDELFDIFIVHNSLFFRIVS